HLPTSDRADFARGADLSRHHDFDRASVPSCLTFRLRGYGKIGRMIRPRFALLACGLAAGLSSAHAQTPPTPSSAQSIQKSEREKELKLLRRDIESSREREQRLKTEIDKIKHDRTKLSKALVDSAAHARATEAKLSAAEAKLEPLDLREAEIKKS